MPLTAGTTLCAEPQNRQKLGMLTKARSPQRHHHGFTLVEITVVLVLMAIIAAYVIGRSATTDQVPIVF